MAKVILKDKDVQPFYLENSRADNLRVAWEKNPESSDIVRITGRPDLPGFAYNRIKYIIPDEVPKPSEAKRIYQEGEFVKLDEEWEEIEKDFPNLDSINQKLELMERRKVITIYNRNVNGNFQYQVYPQKYFEFEELYSQYNMRNYKHEFGEKQRLIQLDTYQPKTF